MINHAMKIEFKRLFKAISKYFKFRKQQMATVVPEEELYHSCRIIFGKDLKVSRDFLQYLQLTGIKKDYRKKTLEFHPDR